MSGGNKGLLENSTNICAGVHNATADFTAQNGKIADFHPPLKAKCPKPHKKHHGKHHKRRR